TLEIIPVVVTSWRLEQLLWERLATAAGGLLRRLQIDAAIAAAGAAIAAGLAIASIYLEFPGATLVAGEIIAGLVFLGGVGSYVLHRPAARQVVWPADPQTR